MIKKKYSIRTQHIHIQIKIVNENSFDWDNYFSIIGMLKIIRKSTDRSYILPAQKNVLS